MTEAWRFFVSEEMDRMNMALGIREIGIFRDIVHSLYDPTVTDAEFREGVKICLIANRIIRLEGESS
jgi:hypothetical protein